jgi:glycosyltransferase involved in cell wall biosynthesis
MTDLAVLAPDPRFGGGGRAQTEAFWRAASSLGRTPHLYFVAYAGLRGRDPGGVVAGEHVRAIPGLDGLSQWLAARRLAPRVAAARSLWVVSPAAPHGAAASHAGRPYGAWIGTSLADEWRAREPYLDRARRSALALSGPTLRRLERETLRGAARLYATSPASRAAIASAASLDERDVGILPIPVDPERFRPLDDDAWQAGLARPTIVFAGRGDDPRKNVGLLLDAFDLVRRRLPDARLVLAGTPPAGALPDGAEAVGEVGDVGEVVRRCAVFALPSRQEGFGIVAAEALACGVPVVTTPSGGPEALVRESGGGLVLSGFSAEELASTLTDLLGDAARLAAMRAAGREHVTREHSPERFRSLLGEALAAIDAT